MHRGRALFAAAALVASTLGTIAFPGAAGAEPRDGRADRSYIVVLEDDADARRDSHALAGAHGGQARHVYDDVLNGFNFVGSEQGARNLARNPKVASVVPDGEARIFAQTEPTGTDRIDADRRRSENTGAGAVVAVIDTGIDLDHPDLDGNIDAAAGKDCYNNDESPADDDNGHGTHVAGTIAAENNAEGVVGVAPGATLVPIKVLSSSGSGSWSSVICGIEHATDIGADVANMSLGGDGSDTTCDGFVENTSDVLHEALCGSVDAGVTHVVAAGNDGDDAKNHVPAAFDEAITVSAFVDLNGAGGESSGCLNGGPPWSRDCDESLAYFTNYGENVVITAPGRNIFSTEPGGNYGTKSGTSMAAPHVAGVAALVKAAQPATTPAGIEDILTQNGECPGGTASGGDGLCDSQWPKDPDNKAEPLLDAEAIVDDVGGDDGTGNSNPTVSITNPADGAIVSGTVSIAADATDDGSVSQVEFFVDSTSIGTDTHSSDGWSVNWDSTSVSDGSYSITATATDNESGTASNSRSVTVDNVDDPPSVSITNPADGSTVSGTVDVTADATDDGSVSQVEFFVDSTSIGTDTDGSDGWSSAWDTTGLTNGTSYTVKAVATDSGTQTASDSHSVTVDNSTPTITADVSYATDGGPNGDKHLHVTVALTDGSGNPLADASVSIDLYLDTSLYASGSGTTGTDGTVTFKATNARAGTYTTDVTQVVLSDGTTFNDPDENDPGITK